MAIVCPEFVQNESLSMTATLKDVAELAGVHPSTVSRVLRRKESLTITEKTRKRIFKAAKQLNYQPDQTARALRLKKSNTIGLIIPDISNPFFSQIARSIEIESYSSNYTLVVCNTNENQAKEIRYVHDLLSRGIDGLIIAPVQDKHDHILELQKKDFPFVLIDRAFNNIDSNAVVSNNEQASYNAVAYLAKLGHRRIAFLSGRRNIYTIQTRLKGYNKAIKDFNLYSDPELIVGDGFTFESGYEATLALMNLSKPPTAILISGNIITIGSIKAILERGYSIPNDFSIVGFTDTILSPYLICPLTTVSHPLKEMGQKAFSLLLKHIETKENLPKSKIVVTATLDIRKSTAPLPN